MANKTTGKANNKRARRKERPCHISYVKNHFCERNKIKRVFQSSGLNAANEYSKKYGVALPRKAQEQILLNKLKAAKNE
jgi:hypothetical protein